MDQVLPEFPDAAQFLMYIINQTELQLAMIVPPWMPELKAVTQADTRYKYWKIKLDEQVTLAFWVGRWSNCPVVSIQSQWRDTLVSDPHRVRVHPTGEKLLLKSTDFPNQGKRDVLIRAAILSFIRKLEKDGLRIRPLRDQT